MQRVRIGLTVLAGVFVVMLLAGVFSHPSNEPRITANSLDHEQLGNNAAPDSGAATEPKEPLAELGVAPGGAPDTNSSDGADH